MSSTHLFVVHRTQGGLESRLGQREAQGCRRLLQLIVCRGPEVNMLFKSQRNRFLESCSRTRRKKPELKMFAMYYYSLSNHTKNAF